MFPLGKNGPVNGLGNGAGCEGCYDGGSRTTINVNSRARLDLTGEYTGDDDCHLPACTRKSARIRQSLLLL